MSDPVVLSAAGVGLVLDVRGPGLPRVVHWGADPGPLSAAAAGALAGAASPPAAAVDGADPWGPLPLLPAQWDGWAGRHGATGSRSGRWPHLRLVLDGTGDGRRRRADGRGGRHCRRRRGPVPGVADAAGRGNGPARTDQHRRRRAGRCPRCAACCPCRTGRPSCSTWPGGGRWNGCRSGTRSHTAPTRGKAAAGVPDTTPPRYSSPACPVSPSAPARYGPSTSDGAGTMSTTPSGSPARSRVLGGGELLAPGEVRLAPGETYTTPEAYFVWSDAGLDGLSDRLHAMLRARPAAPAHAAAADPQRVGGGLLRPRPRPADRARRPGGRDRRGAVRARRRLVHRPPRRHRRARRLGGRPRRVGRTALRPLVDHVRSHGMQFGLWFEPEMVNPDSDLARAHPDWLLAAPAGGRPARSASSRSWTSPDPRWSTCCSTGSPRWSPRTASTTSSGTTTATFSRRRPGGGGRAPRRPWRRTG